jgi:hypothetical protein
MQVAALQALHGDRPPVCMHIHTDSMSTLILHQERTVKGGNYGPTRALSVIADIMGLTLVDVRVNYLHRPGLALDTLQSAHLGVYLRTWVVLKALL